MRISKVPQAESKKNPQKPAFNARLILNGVKFKDTLQNDLIQLAKNIGTEDDIIKTSVKDIPTQPKGFRELSINTYSKIKNQVIQASESHKYNMEGIVGDRNFDHIKHHETFIFSRIKEFIQSLQR